MSSEPEPVSSGVAPGRPDRVELGLALVALIGCVAYGWLHPLSSQVGAPRWFWVSAPLVVFALALWQRRDAAKLWYVSAGLGLASVGFAFYEHARALSSIQLFDQEGLALLAYAEASAAARGVVLIGVGVALLSALVVELISVRRSHAVSKSTAAAALSSKAAVATAAAAKAAVSPQAWVALATWVAALIFGRVMLELPWSLEDFCAVFSVLALALLVHAGASLSVAVWVPLGFVVLAWLRADVDVVLNNYDYESLYSSGLRGGLDLVRRERLVVLDSAASGAAVLLLLWSLRARLRGQLGRAGAVLLLWLAVFGAERFLAQAQHELAGLRDTLARADLALPEVDVRPWLPRAPLWVVGRQRELWLAPDRYELAGFEPGLLAGVSPTEGPAAEPTLPREPDSGGPQLRPAQGLQRPAVVLAAPADMKLALVLDKLGDHAQQAFGLLVRDSSLQRRDALARAATTRAVVFRLAPSLKQLPPPERPDVRRYFYSIGDQTMLGAQDGGDRELRRGAEEVATFACSRLSSSVHEERACDVVVGVDPSWRLRQLMTAVAPLLSRVDAGGSVSFILVEDVPGVAARVQQAP